VSTIETFDFVVIGAGVAGCSVACELSARGRVAIVERESQPGYHASGRSAALYSELYGAPAVRALTRASRAFLEAPPQGFVDAPLLTPRGCLYPADAAHLGLLEHLAAEEGGAVQQLGRAGIDALVPILAPEASVSAVFEAGARDIDVHGLMQGWLRLLRARGGVLVSDARIHAVGKPSGAWRIELEDRTINARVLVNAAGAWADDVARLAGVTPLDLSPRRRTAAVVDAPAGMVVEGWPCVIDAAETYYFKPEAGSLLISPADETETPPCDARPEEIDIAIAVDRFEKATRGRVSRVLHSWAGLRTFAPDRVPVAGFDPRTSGFFWLAGQGGSGVMTAPALARLSAALIAGERVPQDIPDHGVEPELFAPARFGL
jgi:D-arginine dehydrogenase